MSATKLKRAVVNSSPAAPIAQTVIHFTCLPSAIAIAEGRHVKWITVCAIGAAGEEFTTARFSLVADMWGVDAQGTKFYPAHGLVPGSGGIEVPTAALISETGRTANASAESK